MTTADPNLASASVAVVKVWRPTNGATYAAFGQTTASELLRKVLPPVNYIIPGFLAEGLTLFGGKPKIGKSWLMLGLAASVALGERALGSIPVEQGDVLYLALEDNERRLKKRMEQLLPAGVQPGRLYVQLSCERLDRGGVDQIRQWIGSKPKPRLVVIDVLNRFRPQQKQNEGIYDYDVRSLEPLHALAAETGIAIVVVHHTRKAEAVDPFDCLSGSTGLTGTADTTLVLSRGSQGVTLYGRGRDIEEVEAALQFNRMTGAWTTLGETSRVARSDTRGGIVALLQREKRPMAPKAISEVLGLTHSNVRATLRRMCGNGEVQTDGKGTYSAVVPLSL